MDWILKLLNMFLKKPAQIPAEKPAIEVKKPSENKELAPVSNQQYSIEWKKSPNYSAGNSKSNTAIILHHTGSFNMDGDIAWMCNPEAKVSAHYVVGLDGRVVQLVRDQDLAWHAGQSELDGQKYCNSFSLGIELVGNTVKQPLSQPQYHALVWLVRRLMGQYNIPAHRCVDHRRVAPGRKVDLDPKNFDWIQFYKDLGSI